MYIWTLLNNVHVENTASNHVFTTLWQSTFITWPIQWCLCVQPKATYQQKASFVPESVFNSCKTVRDHTGGSCSVASWSICPTLVHANTKMNRNLSSLQQGSLWLISEQYETTLQEVYFYPMKLKMLLKLDCYSKEILFLKCIPYTKLPWADKTKNNLNWRGYSKQPKVNYWRTDPTKMALTSK